MVLKMFAVIFSFVISLQSKADSAPELARKISSSCRINRCTVGALIYTQKNLILYKEPESKKLSYSFKKGTEALILDYQKHVYPSHVKTSQLDFYLKDFVNNGVPTWTIWINGKVAHAKGDYDKTKEIWKIEIDGKSYELKKNEISSSTSSQSWWIKIQTLNGKRGWIEDEYATYGNGLLVRPYIEDEEKISQLKNDWKDRQKRNFIGREEALNLIRNHRGFDYKNAFRPRVFHGFTYPEIAYHSIQFEKSNKIYKFKSCKFLKEELLNEIPMTTIGEGAYRISYNDFFIKTKNGLFSEMFLDECMRLTENNTYECPDYVNDIENVISKVGPILAIEDGSYGGGGCGPPYSNTRVKSIDLRTNKIANITDFFDKTSLVEALLKDKLIQTIIERSPAKFKELSSAAKNEEEIMDFFDLQGFGIYEEKIRDGKIRIRWARHSSDCGMCPNNYEWIGIDVKPLPWFLEEFKMLNPNIELYLNKQKH